ncbi:MAG: protein kinase [Ktedonobacteraceae bacterium]|nr:protein kinase [Ktedonobacteraceae bacterium]
MPRCPNPRCQIDYPPGTTRCTNPLCRCLLPEAVVAGRYRIETLIGMGGMGSVYRASDTFEIQQVALKILSFVNNAMEASVAVERFRREARYAHQLKHKNIVPILNFGQDGELLYITMPLITGGTLKSLLKAEHPLPLRQAQSYLNDLAAAIDMIHSHPQQIVHRDIKPSNLLIHQDDGRLVVTDFGIARAMQQEKPLTQRGWTLGTEHYIAPEQEHGNAQPASDIYAMGVVAYQMFTGLLPFQAVVRNRAAELPAPSFLNAALPSSVDPVILRAMDIEPQKRYSSGRAFADALNDALSPDNGMWAEETIADTSSDTISPTNANVIVRALIPQNPCSQCGRENRTTSRFCRHCGHTLNDTSPFSTEAYPVGYMSDIGQHARENEDMLLVVQGLCVTLPIPPHPFGLFAVADGLQGTHGKSARGHEASRLAIETVADVLIPQLSTPAPSQTSSVSPGGDRQPSRIPPKPPSSEAILEKWTHDAVRQANQVIYHCNADYDTTMACTLTVAVTYKQHLYIASVGDSRAYHYSPTKALRLLTQDYTTGSSPQRNDAADNSSKRQQYYLGQNYRVPIDIVQYEIEAGDIVLLCTDGLWHMIADDRIQEILSQGGDPQRLATTLVAAANHAGGEGNISAVVALVQ